MFSPVFTFMALDFAVPVSFSGYVSGMYTSGAVLSGIIAFYWVDRCNKKRFLIANMVLLAMATLLTTFVTSFPLLLTLRFFAGLVGGTTMGVGIGILINHTPADLRGKMLATVIASFSLVSVVGMPAILFSYSLRLACRVVVNQHALFVGIAIDRHCHSSGPRRFRHVSRAALDVDTLLFASGNALVQFSPMLIIPVLAPLMTQLLGASEGLLPWLFFGGDWRGICLQNDRGINLSFFCIEFGDRVNPRFYSELADTLHGLSASGAVYDVISRGSLQSSGFIFGGYDSVS